jgi:hypothetical protein
VSVTQLDPTQTSLIRRQYEADAKRRWNEFKKLLAAAFIGWLLRPTRQDDDLLAHVGAAYDLTMLGGGVLTRYWWDPYILQTYAKAVDRAYSEVSKPPAKPNAAYAGGKGAFRAVAMGQATTGKALQAHAALTAQRWAALGEMVKSAVAVALADGAGKAPAASIAVVAKRAVNVLVTNRAPLVVSEAVARTYTGATLDAYTLLGVKRVGADVEFVTAAGQGASRTEMSKLKVCPKCQALSGKVYTTTQARGVIPVHPLCRCRWVPA